MANLTYEERVALEQQKEALRRQREDERRNGVAGVRANDTRIAANNDAMHGRAGRKWLGGEAGAVSSGDALHGQAGRKWLGGGGQQTQEPRSNISFFASDGQGRISRGVGSQVADTDVWGNDWRLRMYADQMASHDEMGQVMQTVRQKKAQQQLALQNDIASLMKYAQGGAIPEELRQLVNRKYGFDGVKSGLLPSSGFTQNGDFALQVANGVDRNGNVQVQTIGINPFQQYMMMQTNDAAFDDNDRAALRQRLKQNDGYSDRELAAVERMRVPDLKQALEERKMALSEQKQRDLMERFRQTMAQKNAPKSKTDFIGKMFESGNYANRLSTEDDVANNRATTVGEPIERTPEELIEYLGNIYDKIYRNQDPALGGGQVQAQTQTLDNGSWKVAMNGNRRVSDATTDENGKRVEAQYENGKLYRNSETGEEVWVPDGKSLSQVLANTPGTEAQPPAAPAGGEAAPAQTATPSHSATARPPSKGQGELDFGGEEPEAGNLTHEGRKWKLYTDDNGKVSGYGTTRSIVTKTDDGRFAVIPTIVNGEELSEADAVEHFKKTGEHWGIVKTEDEAKKLAEQVHLDGQEHERAAWNDYIQDHWDEMSDEIRNDPGVAEERKRRQAAKPKSNSWKNSALFK